MITKMTNNDVKIFLGVLSGFAYHFKVDPFWIRILFLVLFLGSLGTGFIIYLLCALIMDGQNVSREDFEVHIAQEST